MSVWTIPRKAIAFGTGIFLTATGCQRMSDRPAAPQIEENGARRVFDDSYVTLTPLKSMDNGYSSEAAVDVGLRGPMVEIEANLRYEFSAKGGRFEQWPRGRARYWSFTDVTDSNKEGRPRKLLTGEKVRFAFPSPGKYLIRASYSSLSLGAAVEWQDVVVNVIKRGGRA